ncbi:MAG: hypothetical protein GX483_08865 [Actinomycetaceae bacterium]|nr:hypothetical protein [Actinomycetaceae bacterium]
MTPKFAIFLWIIVVGVVAYISVPRPKIVIQKPRRRQPKVRLTPPELDLGMLVTEVATRLRSGAQVEQAWEAALESYGYPGSYIDEEGVPSELRRLWELGPFGRRRARLPATTQATIPATFAVCRMGYRTGAPLADILDACAEGMTEAGEAIAAREVALAGPITSARMLAILPFIGMGLAYVMGVNPLGFFFGGALGSLVGVVGLAFEIAGVIWVARLVRRAKEEGQM